jgi:hypothetical protein
MSQRFSPHKHEALWDAMGRYGSLWDTFLHLWDKRPNVPNPCKGLGWDGLWDGTEWGLKQALKQGLNDALE